MVNANVYLQEPGLQVRVYEDVEPEQLVAAVLRLDLLSKIGTILKGNVI